MMRSDAHAWCRNKAESLAARHKLRLIPFLLAGVAGIDTLNQGDGIHPNPAGSVRVAENVWQTLKPILDSLARSGH